MSVMKAGGGGGGGGGGALPSCFHPCFFHSPPSSCAYRSGNLGVDGLIRRDTPHSTSICRSKPVSVPLPLPYNLEKDAAVRPTRRRPPPPKSYPPCGTSLLTPAASRSALRRRSLQSASFSACSSPCSSSQYPFPQAFSWPPVGAAPLLLRCLASCTPASPCALLSAGVGSMHAWKPARGSKPRQQNCMARPHL